MAVTNLHYERVFVLGGELNLTNDELNNIYCLNHFI